jgi:hypothetical protein
MGVDPEAEPSVGGTLSRFLRWAKRRVAAVAPHRRIEITIDTDRIVIIRRRKSNPDSEPPSVGEAPGPDLDRNR